MRKTQIVIKLSNEKDVEEIDAMAANLGFPSRVSYFLHLHHAYKSAIELTEIESLTLSYLGDWEFKNPRTASLKTLAKDIDCDEKLVKKTLESLCVMEIVVKTKGPFHFGVQDGNTFYQLTKKGYAAARALLLRDGREATLEKPE